MHSDRPGIVVNPTPFKVPKRKQFSDPDTIFWIHKFGDAWDFIDLNKDVRIIVTLSEADRHDPAKNIIVVCRELAFRKEMFIITTRNPYLEHLTSQITALGYEPNPLAYTDYQRRLQKLYYLQSCVLAVNIENRLVKRDLAFIQKLFAKNPHLKEIMIKRIAMSINIASLSDLSELCEVCGQASDPEITCKKCRLASYCTARHRKQDQTHPKHCKLVSSGLDMFKNTATIDQSLEIRARCEEIMKYVDDTFLDSIQSVKYLRESLLGHTISNMTENLCYKMHNMNPPKIIK
jgi:hypothetical protein